MKLTDLFKRLIQWFRPPKEPIKDYWTLQEFINTHGKMQIHVFTDNLGNKTIDRCRFIDEECKQTEVFVAKVLQGYSKEQLLDNKESLFVKTLGSGKLCLCKEWEDIENTGW
jgi:hypothetical protein